MFEKLINRLGEMTNQITSHVVIYNEPERGIGFEFVFGGECSVEEWEKAFDELKKEKLDSFLFLREVIREANNRTLKEREEFVNFLSTPIKGIGIFSKKGARERQKAARNFIPHLININSMSESNLANMQGAIDNLEKN